MSSLLLSLLDNSLLTEVAILLYQGSLVGVTCAITSGCSPFAPPTTAVGSAPPIKAGSLCSASRVFCPSLPIPCAPVLSTAALAGAGVELDMMIAGVVESCAGGEERDDAV